MVDIEALRGELLELSWVKDARVSRQLPDRLVIDMVERKPHAVLRKADRLVLIDATGHELEPVSAARAKGKLVVAGPGAGKQVAALARLLEAAPALKPQVREAEWVGNRRWNLTFQTGQVLALPEGPQISAKALMSFARLDGTNRLLGGKVAAFDMRAPDRIYLRVPGRTDPVEASQLRAYENPSHAEPDQTRPQEGDRMMAAPRISRVFGAVNIGSFRISAMIAGLSETGEMIVLGSGHRAAQGIKRGYVTDMQAATYAVRDAVERAEKIADVSASAASMSAVRAQGWPARSRRSKSISAGAGSSRTMSNTCWSPGAM